uniref:RRM domain-containing protein n=1 Tax=Octactis speculum TaxID=3111310 RepID=A0A7S2G062_9STRA
MSYVTLVLALSGLVVRGYLTPTGSWVRAKHTTRSPSPGSMGRPRTCLFALDYKDPEVAAEYAAVQEYDMDKIEEELMNDGIFVPATMDEVSARMMLVEVRMRKTNRMGAFVNQAEKTVFANEYERCLYEKPAFKELIAFWSDRGNTNAVNLAVEYLNNRKQAKQRYEGNDASGNDLWLECTSAIEAALNKKIEQVVSTGKIAFNGLPAGLGEAGARSMFEGFGVIKDFTDFEVSDDFMSASGRVEYEEVESAKSAIDKYDGVDMGLGTKLVMKSLP